MSPRRAHAAIRLPPLDPTSALSVINVLDAVIDALWRAHRDGIIELQTDVDTGAPRASARRAPVDDDDIF
jgi:hypothetical protein